MSQYHIAQVNISRLAVLLNSPQLARFIAFLGPIYALAEASPGFVWRFQTEAGDATGLRVYDDDSIIVNFSVWESIEALKNFTYRGNHSEVMRRRSQWFEKMDKQHMALWWVPVGHRPTWAEAQDRLESLRANGETPYAFSFQKPFPPPEE